LLAASQWLGSLVDSTTRRYAHEFRRFSVFAAALRVDPISASPSLVQRFLAEEVQGGRSVSSVKQGLSFIRTVQAWAGRSGLQKDATFAQWTRAAVKVAVGRSVTAERAFDPAPWLCWLRDHAPAARRDSTSSEFIAARDHCILLIATFAFPRAADIAKLTCRGARTRHDVTLVFDYTKELRLSARRGRHSPHIFIGSCSLPQWDIVAWLERLGRAASAVGLAPDRPRLLCKLDGSELTASGVCSVLRSALRAAGVDATAHAFRATFSSAAVDLGISEEQVVRTGRWSSAVVFHRHYCRLGNVSRVRFSSFWPRDDIRSLPAALVRWLGSCSRNHCSDPSS
jgi:hypothetical protein